MFLGFFRNFPMGVLLGLLVATIAFLFLDDNYDKAWAKYFAYGVSALVGLLAAGLALLGVMSNIHTQISQEQERRSRAFIAARSTLPLALSNMGAISRRGIEICISKNCGDASFTELAKELAVDGETISTITRVIEFADEQSGERLGNIVGRHQMMVSRIVRWGASGHAPSRETLAKEAVNWAVQSHLIGDAFGFARGDEMQIPKELQNRSIESTFFLYLGIVINPNDYADLYQAVVRFKETGDTKLQ